uniref:DNL-type domain-containing protein n=1 Tax=Chlamydomonas leiostraca TaxID=1034604 RepID=A0A7S0X048_9CHLO|mmetsp:Transcript_464/g.1233  ORF Transcript_464/g.1233 Transcript_464/m.1233 type:complete len:279 (+) Transcript_464:108-944(+)
MLLQAQRRVGGASIARAAPSKLTTSRVVRALASANECEPEVARAVPLPSGGLWLLDYLQNQFYDVRGDSFVVKRAESEVEGAAPRSRRVRSIVPNKQEVLGMIHKAVWHHPERIMLEGPTVDAEAQSVDITDCLEVVTDEEQAEASRTITPNTTCTGIIMVPQADAEEERGEIEEIYVTNSTSPRRTKMVGFTCQRCGARNMSAINPNSFLSGTLVAQCAKCEVWHKLSDHLGLFHELKGPVFGRAKGPISMADIPPSLRHLDPTAYNHPPAADPNDN